VPRFLGCQQCLDVLAGLGRGKARGAVVRDDGEPGGVGKGAGGGRVAVVGWQWEWYRWIERIKAVRMVPDRVWQWQY
jgi:hypothetical protein